MVIMITNASVNDVSVNAPVATAVMVIMAAMAITAVMAATVATTTSTAQLRTRAIRMASTQAHLMHSADRVTTRRGLTTTRTPLPATTQPTATGISTSRLTVPDSLRVMTRASAATVGTEVMATTAGMGAAEPETF